MENYKASMTTLLVGCPVLIPSPLSLIWASLVAQLVKNLPAMQETLVGFLGREDPLEKRMAILSSIFGFPWWLRW